MFLAAEPSSAVIMLMAQCSVAQVEIPDMSLFIQTILSILYYPINANS